jgi:hypothetical protein
MIALIKDNYNLQIFLCMDNILDGDIIHNSIKYCQYFLSVNIDLYQFLMTLVFSNV